jgi:hypothetical protein
VSAAASGGGGTPAGHGTGYEDAITRRINAAESEAKALRDRVGRAEATVEELARDNATLRRRAEADASRVRRAGLFLAMAAGIALACLAALAFVLIRGGR